MRALVTGGSSGIGRAIAGELAALGWPVVLVGRGRAALEDAAAGLAAPAEGAHEVLAADLAAPEGVAAVRARLLEAPVVDVLVHSAGVGLPPGGYLGNPVEASRTINALTTDAITELTRAALPAMLERGRGGVLTVSSIAGFLPGTPAITYSASKAWATAFGEGLSEVLRGTPVTSTVVAPGFVRSGFHRAAGLAAAGEAGGLWSTPELVARQAVRGFLAGRALVVPGWRWKAVYAAQRIAPRSWSRRAFAAYMRRSAGAGGKETR